MFGVLPILGVTSGQPKFPDKGKPFERAGRKTTGPWVGLVAIRCDRAWLQDSRVAWKMAVAVYSASLNRGLSDECFVLIEAALRTSRLTSSRLSFIAGWSAIEAACPRIVWR